MTWEALEGLRVLVTGATGFIGGRIVERLSSETGARVRVATRNLARLPRVTRFDVDIAHCDLLDKAQVSAAVRKADTIFHCAYGNSGNESSKRQVTIDGTRNLLDAAEAFEVKRFVHFSTFSTYGLGHEGQIDETTPRKASRDQYSRNKLSAEQLVLQRSRGGLDAVVLQPTVVYGPFGTTWTSSVLRRLQTGQVILVDGGTGVCNAVYVDDVVTAAFLAATLDGFSGQAFLISGEQPVSWKDFFLRYEQMLGLNRTVSLSRWEAYHHWQKMSRRTSLLSEAMAIARRRDVLPRLMASRESELAIRLLRRVLSEKQRRALLRPQPAPGSEMADRARTTIHVLTPHEIEFFASKATVAIDKARRVLGFRPAFSFDQGMRLTELWAQWAELAPGGRLTQANSES